MLEWYRSYCGLAELGEDLRGLVEALAGPVRFKVVRVAELFEEILSFRLTPQTSGAELTELLKQKGASAPDGEVWNDLFHRLWVEFIDPRLGEVGEALLVSGYPPSQAALARIGADGWAERLEFYWRGLEIANGFHELNSPVEQRLRAEQDLRERQRLGGTQIPIDEKFLCSLEAGMAPGAGIAVGLERLFMAIYGVKDIRELKAFAL